MRERKAAQAAPAIAIAALALLLCPSPASAAPSCAEGPETVGDTIVGTPCDDTIRPPRSVTTVFGEGGRDTIYGGRGNDSLFGGPGEDRLYGGIGDDRLRGGPEDDRLSGGFGADSLDGEAGDDLARGDATIDTIDDTGGGTDTLSYATGATPGFFNKPGNYPDFSVYDGFPTTVEGRGAYVNLQTGKGDNGLAPDGGGVDEEVDGTSFEVVIGTPFPDYIAGTGDDETIYGGGGADVLLGEGGDDVIYGGAEGDTCDAPVANECEFDDEEVDQRDPSAIVAGEMAPQLGDPAALYLTGSDEDDEVTASFAAGAVTFALGPGSDAGFDPGLGDDGGCEPPAAGAVVCPIDVPPDSIVLAGLAGDDALEASGFPESTSVVVLGGDGGDEIVGGDTEDALVDGDGDDVVGAAGGDDAVPNNEGADDLQAGSGEDLFISDSVCEGDSLDGGPGRDNANWANFDEAIAIDMEAGAAGLLGSAEEPDCGPDPITSLQAIEDIEGTSLGDALLGDSGPNQILGRLGPDTYRAGAGEDSILANSGTPVDDPDPVIECGSGFDTAQIDRPENGPDAAPVECESIHERDPNSFRPPDTPPDPNPEQPPIVEEAGPPPPPRDRTPPRTRFVHRPGGLLLSASRRRTVAFSFAANEVGSSFLCKLDRALLRPCRSPRRYRLPAGRHAFRVLAVDRAGNRDRSAAVAKFRIRRR